MMEITVQSSKNEQFCLNFRIPLWASSSEAEWEKERGEEFKGERETIGDWRERRETDGLVKWPESPRRAGPPAPAGQLPLVHGIEDRIPSVSLNIGAPVFIHPFSWATVFFLNLKCFPDFQVVVQFPLVFVGHGLNHFKVRDVEWFIAVLVVLADATMRPVSFLNGTLMLTPLGFAATASFANVYFFTFRTNMFVNAWFFSWVDLAFIFAT